MGEPSKPYNLGVVYEFYSSYTTFIDLITPVGKKALDQPLLDHTLVRGTRVDLSKKTIRILLFRSRYERPTTIIKFNYRMRMVKSKRMRDPNLHEQ